MFRCFKVKRSVLPGIFILKSCARDFHASPKIYVRRILSKNISNSVKTEDFENNVDPALKCQNSSVDFFGIESNEGVITLKSPQYPLQEPELKGKLREKFHRTSFGVVRYDAENKLKFHAQYQRKTDFSFPLKNREDAEVSQEIKKFPVQSVNYSKTICNGSELHKNCESSVEEEKDVSYIDEHYFNTSETENTNNYNNDYNSRSSEELSFVDKNYFDNISERENTLNKTNDIHASPEELNFLDQKYSENLCNSEKFSVIDEVFVEKKHCSDYPTQSAEQELNYIEEMYLKNDLSGIQKSLNKKELPGMIQNPKSNLDCTNKLSLDMNNIKSFHMDLKSDIADQKSDIADQKSDYSVNNATSNLENSHILPENADCNKQNVTFSYGIKNESFIEQRSRKSTRLGKIPNENFRHKLKYALKDDLETSSSRDMSKTDLVSKQKRKEDNITFDKNAIKSNETGNDSKQSNSDIEEPSTAHEFVTKLRKEREIPLQNVKKERENESAEEKFDSKGFRILKNQVDDLTHFTRDEILNLLKKSVVYSDDDLLILNKPYGLVIHESQTTSSPCLSSFLDDLAKQIDLKNADGKLLTVHRLDKETTGCLLLARNENMAQYLKCLFAERKIIKKYWIVTTRVPDPPKGIIDIPITEGTVDNKRRMVLHAKLPKDIEYRNHSKKGKEAITSYEVISTSGNAALVEVFPRTGIKHQIRVHFGFGLSCPILGDHKYSHLDKLAPQKLQSDILQRLKVRQSKVRYIPMHIHAKSVTIPKYSDGRDLIINLPLPNHMKINLRRLKFKK